MKKLFYLASVLFLGLAACTEKNPEPEPEPGPGPGPVDPVAVTSVTLSQKSAELFVGDQLQLSATVSPSNADDKTVTWTSSNPSVGSISKIPDKENTISVTALEEGNVTITAKAGNITANCEIVVHPAENPYVFSLDPTSVSLPAEGGEFVVTVTCSGGYHVNQTPDWVTEVSVKDKKHTFLAQENGPEERSGVIVFCDDVGTCLPVQLVQAAGEDPYAPFGLSPNQVDVAGSGGTFQVKVTCSTSYHINSMPDWVHEESVSNKVHTFTADPNPEEAARSGVIVFCDDVGTCLPCYVSQAGKPFDPNEINWDEDFYHHSLFMRFTATWCGYCPMMNSAAKKAAGQLSGKLLLLNLHGGGSMYEFAGTNDLIDLYGIEGFPTGVMDGRQRVDNTSVDSEVSEIVKAFNKRESAYPVVSTVGFSSTLEGRKLTMDLNVYIKEAGSYKVTAVVVEDGIVDYQEDYVDGNHYDYHHDAIARVAVTDVKGEAFSAPQDRYVWSKQYTATIPSQCHLDQLRILVYVQRAYGSLPKISSSDYPDYFVDNCAAGIAGDTLYPGFSVEFSGGNEDVTGGDPIHW